MPLTNSNSSITNTSLRYRYYHFTFDFRLRGYVGINLELILIPEHGGRSSLFLMDRWRDASVMIVGDSPLAKGARPVFMVFCDFCVVKALYLVIIAQNTLKY